MSRFLPMNLSFRYRMSELEEGTGVGTPKTGLSQDQSGNEDPGFLAPASLLSSSIHMHSHSLGESNYVNETYSNCQSSLLGLS